jgi:hypothetical protein
VILDVNRDKYLCVDRAQFESLGPWIDAWQEARAPGSEPATGPSPSALALANSLLNVGILSKQAHGAREARATTYSQPTSALDPDSAASTHVFQRDQALSFFLACASASKQLSRERFQSIVARVQARKHAQRAPAPAFDLDRARPLIARFMQLRLFYPRPYLCLFDSLALVHFLARFDLYPDWVFGVRADPFEAHCWVQAENSVLNDTVERVSALTPIMVV